MSHGHIQQLVACIRSCGVTFNIWESESSDGKVEWTSLTGEAKKKVLKVQHTLCNGCVPILSVHQLLPSKMKDIPIPNAFLHDVVKLWKVQYSPC